MRFLKVFVFILSIISSLNAFALTNQQLAYLMNEKGYSAQQVGDYERRAKQRMEDRKAGKTPSALTEEDNKILNDAKAPEAATYGQEQPGALANLGAAISEYTGMANTDVTGVADVLNKIGEASMAVGAAALGAATGGASIALGAGLGTAFTVGAGTTLLLDAALGVPILSDSGTFCKIRNAFVSINGGCLFCGIFGKLFEAINNFSTSISNNMADTFIKLLGLGLLFFILFKVLKAVISFGEIDPKQFFTELFIPFIKALIAVLILMDINGEFGGTSTFYSKIVSPLVELSVGFSNEIQKTDTMQVMQVTRSGSDLKEINACQATSSISGNQNTPMGQGVNEAIQCFLITISVSLINYISMGASFIADCWGMGGFPNVWMFFVGLCIFIPTFIIYLTFPFKLLDGIFQLMFVFALMPLWVILWVLPATRGYTQKAFNMFLRVLITFICLSVVMLMTLKILGVILDGMSEENQGHFWEYLFSDRTKDAAELIDWSTGAFFTCIAMSFLALSLINKVETFVGQFADGGGLGIGSGLESWARKGTQFVADKTVKPLAQKTAKATGQLVGKGVEKTWDSAKAAAKKTPYAAGYAVGAAKRGLRNLNSGPKMTAAQAMTPTGMTPPTGAESPQKPSKLNKKPPILISETLPDESTKETEKTAFTDDAGKKKMEYTRETVKDKKNKEVSTSVKRETFDDEGKKTGSITVEHDKVTGDKKMTQKDSKDREIRTIIKTEDGKTTTQDNYSYSIDGKLDSFEKKIEEKIGDKLNVVKHVRVDAKTGVETDLLHHP